MLNNSDLSAIHRCTKNGFKIKKNQKGESGTSSTRITAFIVLKTATINKQFIKTNSPNKTFRTEWKSRLKLEIINKKPIPKFITATTSLKPLTKSYVSDEIYGA